MVKITRYLDPAAPEGGNGGGTPAPNSGTGNNGAAGANPPAGGGETQEQIVARETQELTSLLEKDEAQLTAEEKTKLASLKDKYEVEPVNPDGTPQTKEQKEAAEKLRIQIEAIKKKPEADRTLAEIQLLKEHTPAPENVYARVDELSGTPIEVDYEDLDPTSPEGILKREEAIREQAVAGYDAELKEKYPIAYQLLLHQQAGGKVEEFFKTQSEDFSTITLTKSDVATQEQVLRKALSLKGNTPEQIDALVTFAKDKGKLFEQSSAELAALQKRQEALEQERTAKAERSRQLERQTISTFFSNMDKALEKEIQGVVIPKGERKAFADFVAQGVFYNGEGKLISTRLLDPTNLTDELAAQYFRFKKGNLSKIVGTKVSQEQVRNLKGKVTYKITPKTSGAPNPNYVPLGEL